LSLDVVVIVDGDVDVDADLFVSVRLTEQNWR